MKKTITAFKETIKELASQQGPLKQERKQSYTGPVLKGDHGTNRKQLRLLYMAYGLMRGKEQIQIESSPKSEIDMNAVNKIIKHYTELLEAEVAECND